MYRGPIIGRNRAVHLAAPVRTPPFCILKQLLDRQPGQGENVAINYSNAQGLVREARARGKAQDLGR